MKPPNASSLDLDGYSRLVMRSRVGTPRVNRSQNLLMSYSTRRIHHYAPEISTTRLIPQRIFIEFRKSYAYVVLTRKF